MTGKRFFILKDDEYEDTLPCIRDRTFKIDDIYIHYKYDNLEEICNELNRLVDENEQLKQENEWLKSIHFVNDVLKENKLLKEKLNEILELIELTGMIHLRKAEIKSIIKR